MMVLVMEQPVHDLTTSDVARLGGVTTDTVRLWERLGRLPAIRTAGGQRLFTREEVSRFLQKRAESKAHV